MELLFMAQARIEQALCIGQKHYYAMMCKGKATLGCYIADMREVYNDGSFDREESNKIWALVSKSMHPSKRNGVRDVESDDPIFVSWKKNIQSHLAY